MTDEHADEPVGSASDEAAKLLAAVRDWAGEWAKDHVGENLDTGAPECTYCPICRTVHVIREAGPEVGVQLASAAASLMQAAAAVLDAAAKPDRKPGEQGVEKIDLNEDIEWEDED